jgi:hypothetical protein
MRTAQSDEWNEFFSLPTFRLVKQLIPIPDDIELVHPGPCVQHVQATLGRQKKLVFANKNYTISYRAHLAATCDTGTYHDGSFCGTRGQSKRVEAMFVEIKPK